MNLNKSQINKLLIIFFFFHIFLWTLVPSITNTNLHLDTIEALAWGNQLQFGYDKYPPIFPLFTEIFFKIFGNQDWAFYLLSQLFVVSSFLIIFQLSKNFFENYIYCFFSVLLLEAIYFFNYTTPELNAFLCQFPFLSLTALYCWRAIDKNKNFDWIMFGFFAGIATLTYYLSLYLLASIAIFFISEIIINKKFNIKYILTLMVYVITLSPHLFWIFQDNFKSIEYAFFRSFGDPLSELNSFPFLGNITYPFIFLIKQTVILVPFFIMLSFIVSSFNTKINLKDKKLIFLFSIAILPIILMFFTSLIGGVRIRTMWMTTFYLFPGIFFLYLFKFNMTLKKYKKFIIIFLSIFLIAPISYGIDSYVQSDKRTDFPGKQIAVTIQTEWNKNFSNSIDVVAGQGWVYGGWYAGNLSYHLKSRPKLKYALNKNLENGRIWIDVLDKIKSCKGVIFKIEPYYEACMIGKK